MPRLIFFKNVNTIFATIMKFQEEINKRRTFGIISHPDAGKTTLTEKLLLFGGAIQTAGAVKNNKIKNFTYLYCIMALLYFNQHAGLEFCNGV